MSDTLLVGTRKGLFRYARKGSSWQAGPPEFSGIAVTAVLSVKGALYAALKHGHFGAKLHRSDDKGKTWQEIASPAFPEDTDGKPSLHQVWVLEADSKGDLYAGCLPAGLFRSRDKGESWSLVKTLWEVPGRADWGGGGYDFAGIHSILPDARKAGCLELAISTAGVWRTEDDCETWTNIGEGQVARYMPPEMRADLAAQDPHCVVRCEAAPNVMWMQHHSGVFRSNDAGAHWSEITPPVSNFGFAVAVHPKDPDTAWLVPGASDQNRVAVDGKLCVTRTNDGGKTWTVLRQGLPQDGAYDLIYRHGLDIAEDGTSLAMGSTGGALWATEDGGDSWGLINGHLPPIYAVRFV